MFVVLLLCRAAESVNTTRRQPAAVSIRESIGGVVFLEAARNVALVKKRKNVARGAFLLVIVHCRYALFRVSPKVNPSSAPKVSLSSEACGTLDVVGAGAFDEAPYGTLGGAVVERGTE